jgi:hypothetical protein
VRSEKNHFLTGATREATQSNIMVDGQSSRASFSTVGGMLGHTFDAQGTAACIDA